MNLAGGYHKVGFIRKDIHNQQARMRKWKTTHVGGALKYLSLLCQKDPIMVVTYFDERERLQYLFWCDAESQMNYKVFGDVLAFDVTYKKNKYLCPFVIFLGVNHYNHTIVFVVVVVTNEMEEIYVWLLKHLIH